MGKPKTPNAVNLLIAKMSRETPTPEAAVAALNDATIGGWQNIYPGRQRPAGGNGQHVPDGAAMLREVKRIEAEKEKRKRELHDRF